jgi:hypothetical protein
MLDMDPATAIARLACLNLDPQQESILKKGTTQTPDGRWEAFKVRVVDLDRKGPAWLESILDTRALAGLYALGERLIVHCALNRPAQARAFRRIRALVEGNDHLRGEVKRCAAANGEQRIEFHSGARLHFIVPGRGAGRGFSADCLIWDHAPGDGPLQEMLPSLAGRSNPQMWYAAA